MLIREIRLENILSFDKVQLELRPLNVVIGPNASGKSNFIRSFGLLHELSKNALEEISGKGGPRSWTNQITKRGNPRIRIVGDLNPFQYQVTLRETSHLLEILYEHYAGVFARREGKVLLGSADPESLDLFSQSSNQFDVNRSESVLARVRYPNEPRISSLANALENIRIYRDFNTGQGSRTRNGTESSAKADRLSEDGSNLALVLNEIDFTTGLSDMNKRLQRFSELFENVRVLTRGGITQLYLKEKHIPEPLAATGLSDGTLRLVCLLAVLLDPNPPSLICIEEPETGMHPDSIRMIADLLTEASNRTQLVVTTHSPTLIDALSDQPESVVVCERNLQGLTEFRRLTDSDLTEWLDRYSLGQLWVKGEIGGNRW